MRRISQKEAEDRFAKKKLALLSSYQGNHVKVQIQCSCGTIFEALPCHVFSGHTTSCGCFNKRRVTETKRLSQELVQQRFREHNLELLSDYHGSKKKVKTRCHCGKTFTAYPCDVFSGATVSCGCFRSVDQQEAERRFAEHGLTLLSKYTGNRSRVEVRCRCGREFSTVAGNVFNGSTTSCGCARRVTQADAERRFSEKNLTLISPYRIGKIEVQVRCHCGNVFAALPSAVFSGNTRSCGCSKREAGKRKRKDISGQRFGHLVALERKGADLHGKSLWKCLCDCGNHTVALLSNLLKGGTKSCGCGQRRAGRDRPGWKGCGEIPGDMWSRIRHGAKSRKLSLEITLEDCWRLFLIQERTCAISGAELRFGSSKLKVQTTASFDRVDSDRGYVAGNVQWLHKVVNAMKSDLSQERFVELCGLVADPMNSAQQSPSCTVRKQHWNFKGHGNIGKDYWNRIRSGTRLGTDHRLRRNLSFEISIEYAWETFLKQNGRCALTGMELDWDYSKGPRGFQTHHRGSASLDRIDSEKGYEVGNIQWLHKEVNRMKSDLPETELVRWCRQITRHQTRR